MINFDSYYPYYYINLSSYESNKQILQYIIAYFIVLFFVILFVLLFIYNCNCSIERLLPLYNKKIKFNKLFFFSYILALSGILIKMFY